MGYSAVGLHEPTEGKWGEKIKELAKNGRHRVNPETELDFFYYDRLEDVEKNIKPSLQKKSIVIMDRYYFSNVAYQSARGINPDYIEKKNETVAPIPDITIILDLPAEIALKRIRQKRNDAPNHFERKKYLERVRQIFLEQFNNRPSVRIIDGTQLIPTVASEIWNVIEPLIRNVEGA